MEIVSVNKKSNTNGVKRARSITTQNISKYARRVTDTDNVYDYFLHKRPFANIKILVNQQIIWCDKASLAAASPIFCEQLIKNNKDEPLVFNDIDLYDFLSMLEFIYPIFNPKINEDNISCLVELSSRFQFDVLKHACQFYIMKYLSTIRRILDDCQNLEAEGDYFLSRNNRKNEHHKQRNLITLLFYYPIKKSQLYNLCSEFHNRTCVDAFDITANLCRWLKTYYNDNNILATQAIISVLQQISVNYLEQVMTTVDINDEIKVHIYKERAQYLEEIRHIKPYRLT